MLRIFKNAKFDMRPLKYIIIAYIRTWRFTDGALDGACGLEGVLLR